MTTDYQALLAAACAARERAYAPYSGFRTGAAILDEHGAVHAGCNVENNAYPLGSCAEAGAISAMIAGGGRHIRAIAVVGGAKTPGHCTPCGGCRQRIAEFANRDTPVVMLPNGGAAPDCRTIAELLPSAFHFDKES